MAYAAADAGCAGDTANAPLAPGEEFSVLRQGDVRIPLLPEFVGANNATGRLVVERDRYVKG